MGCFLIFNDVGIPGALSYALKCWNQLNNEFWKTDHYTYSTGWFGYEFSSMDVIVDSLKLQTGMKNQQKVLPNANNIISDLQSRYLSGYGNTPMVIHTGQYHYSSTSEGFK